MGLEFNPYPKSKQLAGHQVQKDKPKHKEKRPKKKKNPHLYRGRIIPNRKERTRITKDNYNRMLEEFGECCLMCGHLPIQAHHLVFRSQFGSGNWRNLAPLCERCHCKAHTQREFAELLRDMRAERFGCHFWKDVYSLFKEGLVNNTTEEAYERFMRGEEYEKNNHSS
ncbi:HNH endonuclease [Cytobacillus horneckiae]|uniref:HNH endonuclease n=1 Tax=Cytobacillus horneckiae TaxID=549687 RepID=UPI00203E54B4|nr:HNH endonuclease [Cytobacillus horneckiae]MCM3180219.1 HNH endonuclease [Cytobacillus horneckiae]